MAKRVNNISYKGIRHTPSLVSDADGYANECVNLSPDGNDLKPMPMPVKKEGYQIEIGHSLVFVHQGIGYENYVEIDETHTRLVFKDVNGNYLYYANSPDFPYWSNESESEVLAIEAMGNTVIVSTKEGVEYIIFQPDVPVTGQTSGGSYKPIGQRPPMPVIEFRLNHEYEYNGTIYGHAYIEDSNALILDENGNAIPMGLHLTNNVPDAYTLPYQYKDIALEELGGLIETNMKKAADEGVFVFPFFIRYAYRMRTGDYIMQSPAVLLLPSTDKSPHLCLVSTITLNGQRNLYKYRVITPYSILQYKTVQADVDDWKDIVSSVDIFISSPFQNYYSDYRTDDENEGYLNGVKSIYHWFYDIHNIDFGKCHADGKVIDLVDQVLATSGNYGTACYHLESVKQKIFHKGIEDNSLYYKVASLDLSELTNMQDYKELSVDNLANLTTMPTLTDDYYTHNAVSPSIMQVYNSRLNMANIRQRVFDGFENAFQPQFASPSSQGNNQVTKIMQAYYRVKKNGTTYTVTKPMGNSTATLDYTTYLYYPDPDCYEAVLYIRASAPGSMVFVAKFVTVPMKRHEYLNGSYWYHNMTTLEQYVIDHMTTVGQPQLSQDPWYEIPNRFMMSSVGNPWHFPVGNQFDIGRREIRALSVNAENMDAPQFGQNPIYVFSADGIWTIAINADGTFNKLSYVSSDVLSEMKLIGRSPTASAQQTTFFKTDRGIMAIIGSQVKDIGKAMKGKTFNSLTKLLPTYSVLDGIPTSGTESYWLDLINKTSDNEPFANFAKTSDLVYDYRNNRLLLLPYAQKTTYVYVYDIDNDFWSKMLPLEIDESDESQTQIEYNSREVRDITLYTEFTSAAMIGSKAVFQDNNGHLWYVGDQPDENNITTRQFGYYVSRPLRFGTDDMKTLTRIVHDHQLSNASERVGMGIYGSVDGQHYYQITKLKGKSYKFFIIVLYTHIYPSSRYAYTAFEWEARMTDKIR